MTRAVAIAVALAALVPARTRADVWRDASDDTARKLYEDQLANGDRAVELAGLDSESAPEAQRNVDAAIQAYRNAAELEPEAAEPYYRIGRTMYQLYFAGCPNNMLPSGQQPSKLCVGDLVGDLLRPRPHELAEQVLAAWAVFEARAPLDPRITANFLFERAILHTKLATPAHWAAAADDYEKLLARDDISGDDEVFNLTEGNLAETYMMLGRLDDAIDMYRQSVRHGGGDSIYGLAVALDRNEQTEQAKDVIHDAGDETRKRFVEHVNSNQWFFVPDGERFYYLALLEESDGDDARALADWQHFIDSGAHPRYQPRARAHLAALRKAHPDGLREPPPVENDDE